MWTTERYTYLLDIKTITKMLKNHYSLKSNSHINIYFVVDMNIADKGWHVLSFSCVCVLVFTPFKYQIFYKSIKMTITPLHVTLVYFLHIEYSRGQKYEYTEKNSDRVLRF